MSAAVQNRSVVIASGGTTSGAIELEGSATLLGIRLPAALTGTAITLTESTSLTGTYQAVYDNTGTQLTFVVAASRTVMIDPSYTIGLKFVKLVSGSSEGADRTIQLIIKEL